MEGQNYMLNKMGKPYDLWSEFYDESVRELSETIWAQGIIAELKRIGVSNGHILDAGAGTGIGCRLLREIGNFEITAVDYNESMLLKLGTLADHIILSDIREIPKTDYKYDVIVSGFDTMNYLNAEGLQKFLLWASDHLSNDGKIIFDYSTPFYLQEMWRNLSYDQPLHKGHTLIWNHHWDDAVECSRTIISLRKKEKMLWSEEHIQYGYDTYKIQKIASSSFLTIQSIRNLDSSNFSPDAETHLILLTRKTQDLNDSEEK